MMQHVAYRLDPPVELERDNDTILHFSLQDALPEGHMFALNTTLGTFSYLSTSDGMPRLRGQQQFTRGEMSMLLPLLESYPYYCPYEVLFASFYNNDTSEQLVEKSRHHLQKAFKDGVWDQEMRPVRTLLSRTRFKTRTFGIDILSILETGYILRYLPSLKPQKKMESTM
ncbi:MAG: hypothetical protein NVS4B11_15630 [Ktedonobacteraceae bacterium]